jgi:ubiquitin-like 1-activating enzyme E1 B
MCVAAGVPLIESGTAGYLGQVQPIIKVNRAMVLEHSK